jgi:hypothetical protein
MKKVLTFLLVLMCSVPAFSWSTVYVRGNWDPDPWNEAIELSITYYDYSFQRNVWGGLVNFEGSDATENGPQYKYLFGNSEWIDFAPEGMTNICIDGGTGEHYLEIVDNKLSGDVVAYRIDYGEWKYIPYSN